MEKFEISKRLPIDHRTLDTEINGAVSTALEYWCWDIVGRPKSFKFSFSDHIDEDYCQYFIDEIFLYALNSPDLNGDCFLKKLSCPNDLMLAITAYAAQAIQADRNGSREKAWACTAQALYWSGILKSILLQDSYGKTPASIMANLRHEETRSMIEEAIAYWEKNIDPNLSAQKAANELLKIVPLSHKKLAEVVSKAKKAKQHVSRMRRREQ